MRTCRTILITASVFVVVLTMISGASAASDYYLKITDVKGEHPRVVSCIGGVCAIKDIDPGSFAAGVCDAQGNAAKNGRYTLGLTFSAAGLRESPSKASTLRESPSKASTGKTSVAGGATEEARSIVSPRDAASGLPTGRRQYQPIRIAKEWDAASPKLASIETPTGGENDQVLKWVLEIRVDRIEMK